MPRITEECVARIKNSADIVEVVGRYIQLRRAGTAWKACCPFHSEKTPSFSVNPARQSFHCFGCGVGGDAVKFVMMFENLDYPTALRRLADIAGVAVIEEDENPEQARRRRRRGRIIRANQLAADYYHRQLCRNRAADGARAYLTGRGFNIAIAKAWKLGWAPPDFRPLAELAHRDGLDDGSLSDAYLLARGRNGLYPVFRDRLMFPIENLRGEIVGFSGRVLEGDSDPRKYVNTAETEAFRKGELLFGLSRATRAIGKAGMSVVICEGQLDVIACHEKADIRNAVAGLGTAFTDEHAALLRKYAGRAILCYDGDSAGIKASEKTYRKLAQAGLEVRQALLPPGEDPDSLIRNQGPEALRQAIDEAQPYLQARLAQELQNLGDDPMARAALITRMADLAAEIADSVKRDVAVVDLASRLNIGRDELRSSVADIVKAKRSAAERERRRAPAPAPAASGDQDREEENPESSIADEPVVPMRLHRSVRNLISLAIGNADAQQAMVERIEELREPIRELPGGIILQRLLEELPEAGKPEAWQAFLRKLTPEQAAGLRDVRPEPLRLSDPEGAVEQSCSCAAADTVRAQIDTGLSLIQSGRLPQDEELALMARVNELRDMLSSAGP